MFWVYGPKHWETNQPAWSGGELHSALYSNAANFSPDDDNPHHPTVVENFWHSAEALRRVLQHFHPNKQLLSNQQIAGTPGCADAVRALREHHGLPTALGSGR
jgi:hypothetical protein